MKWKSIKSVPRDGSEILVADSRGMAIAAYNPDQSSNLTTWQCGTRFILYPTHWAPITLPKTRKTIKPICGDEKE